MGRIKELAVKRNTIIILVLSILAVFAFYKAFYFLDVGEKIRNMKSFSNYFSSEPADPNHPLAGKTVKDACKKGNNSEFCAFDVGLDNAKSPQGKPADEVCNGDEVCLQTYYREKAISTKDYKYCLNISNLGQKDNCLLTVKILTGDSTICDYITTDITKEMCLS